MPAPNENPSAFPPFRLYGEHDTATAASLRSDLLAYAASTEGDVVCDCADLTFLDSRAIAVLVGVRRDLGRTGRSFRLTNVTGLTFRTLEVLGLLEPFGIVDHDRRAGRAAVPHPAAGERARLPSDS